MERERAKDIYFWLGFALCVLGVALSAYLSYLHLRPKGLEGESLCSVNDYMNCMPVLESRFSQFGFVPTAWMGLTFYVYLLGIFLYQLSEPEYRIRTWGLPWVLLHFSVALSVGLAIESVFVIGALCPFCTPLYLVNVLLWIGVKQMLKLKWNDFFRALRAGFHPRALAYGLSLALFSLFSIYQLSRAQTPAATPAPSPAAETPPPRAPNESPELSRYLDDFFRQKANSFNIQGRPVWGNPDAKVTIVEFSDFQCPYCAKAASDLKRILKPFDAHVRLVFLHYPLSSHCNPGIAQEGHPLACAAASASYCAQQQGQFWEFHDRIFDAQSSLSEAKLSRTAEALKLDMQKFQICLKDPATAQFLAQDIAQGTQAGIRGTPSIFVQGRPFQAWPYAEAWQALLLRFLK